MDTRDLVCSYGISFNFRRFMNNEVLIIGGNHQNPLGIIEALGKKGIKSYVLIVCCCKNSFVLKSKYVKCGWICKNYNEALTCIRKRFRDKKSKAVVFACSDDAASMLDLNHDELKDYLILPGIEEQGKLTQWMNKEQMVKEAINIGLSVPQTWIINKNTNLNKIEYPCITKSMSSVNNGKSEFALCKNESDLIYFMQNKAHSEQIQIQKFIDKEYEFQYLGLSLNSGKKIIIPGCTYIPNATNFNNLTFLYYDKCRDTDNKNTFEKTLKFVETTKYSGLFSMEFIHGKDGKDYFLEMNFRNDGNGICVTSAGINLPYIWYLESTGHDYLDELMSNDIKKTYCVPEDTYFISMLNGDISFRQWYQNMKKVTCFITYFKGDTGPFWSLIWMQKRAIIIAAIRRLLRTFNKYTHL